MAPVAKRDVRDVPHAEPVHERHPRFDVVDHADAVRRELEHVAVVDDHDRRRGHPRFLRQAGVRSQHPELAVDRHDSLRPQQADQRPELLGPRMPRHVHGRVLLVQHLRPAPREPVDRVVHAQLVPGTARAEMITVSPRSTCTAG